MTETVALLGLGQMGVPMAANLIAAEVPLSVWNRSPGKAEALVTAGATEAATAEDAVAGAGIVISLLTDGPAVLALLDRCRSALRPGTLWIDMSSTRPAEARAQAAILRALGGTHLDAPVSGGTQGAAAGTLAIMAGGDAADVTRASPVLAALGRVVHVGPSGAGQLAKLANQAIVAATIAAVAEATLLVREGGGDLAAWRDALSGGFADSTILRQHGARMETGDYAPGGRSAIQLKDLRNVLSEAADLGIGLPAMAHVHDRFAHLVDQMDGGDLDHSALFAALEADNR